jgi:hypothetical protein
LCCSITATGTHRRRPPGGGAGFGLTSWLWNETQLSAMLRCARASSMRPSHTKGGRVATAHRTATGLWLPLHNVAAWVELPRSRHLNLAFPGLPPEASKCRRKRGTSTGPEYVHDPNGLGRLAQTAAWIEKGQQRGPSSVLRRGVHVEMGDHAVRGVHADRMTRGPVNDRRSSGTGKLGASGALPSWPKVQARALTQAWRLERSPTAATAR